MVHDFESAITDNSILRRLSPYSGTWTLRPGVGAMVEFASAVIRPI